MTFNSEWTDTRGNARHRVEFADDFCEVCGERKRFISWDRPYTYCLRCREEKRAARVAANRTLNTERPKPVIEDHTRCEPGGSMCRSCQTLRDEVSA